MHQQTFSSGDERNISEIQRTVAPGTYRDKITIVFAHFGQSFLVNMDVPPCQYAAVGGVFAAGADQCQLHGAIQFSRISHRWINAQLEAIGFQQLHLRIGAQRAKHTESAKRTLWATNFDKFIGGPRAALFCQISGKGKSFITEQGMTGFICQMDMVVGEHN